MELILARHAEPVADVHGRCYGALDVGLSATGRATGRRLADRLAGVRVDRVVSSPRRRAIETARPIAERHGLPVETLGGLRELDFGELEGRTYDEIAASRPELYHRWMTTPTEVVFPGGESFADLRLRALEAIAQLRRDAGAETVVVAVTHGGVVRAVIADVLGMPAERIFRLAAEPASVARISWIEDVPVVHSLNHLPAAH